MVGAKAPARIRRDIRFFERDARTAFTAGGGELPSALQRQLAARLARVSAEAADQGTLAEIGNPASPQLAITAPFIAFCAKSAIPCRLEEAGGGENIAGHDFDPEDEDQRAGLSRRMLDFCSGNESQALRLSALVNAESVRLLRSGLIGGGAQASPPVDLPFPEAAGEPGSLAAAWGDGSAPAFTARKRGDGDIELRFEEKVDLQGYVQPRGGRFAFDRNKSAFEYRMCVRIPADPRLPLRLEDAGYAYQIFRPPAAAAVERRV